MSESKSTPAVLSEITTTGDLEKSGLEVMSPTEEKIDIAAERRLLWKIDIHVYPILFIMYMLSFLDRVNISNARIQGLTTDLDLTGNRFNIALFVYFVSYIVCEIPSNIIIHKVRPSWYLGGLMTCWGLINLGMGFVNSYQGLVVLRFFLGIFEAGLLPGIIYLTSMFYKRHEFQTRMNFLFCSTMVGGAVGGLLAYGIANLGGRDGYSAWRWIFIIEGAITAFVGLISTMLIVDWPEQCKFLSAEEKDLLKRRMGDDGVDAARMDTLNAFAYKLILTDWKIYVGALMYFGFGITGYAITYFLPTILLEFGWAAQQAQAETIPVYVVTVAFMVVISYLSDRFRHRYAFILFASAVALVGYAMLLGQQGLSKEARFGATFLVAMGGNSILPIVLTWLANNVAGRWKRAFATAMQVTIGNTAGILASNIFITTESPRYPTGYGTGLGLLLFGVIMSTVMFVGCIVENKKRDAGERDSRLTQPAEEVNNMGDYHPSFRYTL